MTPLRKQLSALLLLLIIAIFSCRKDELDFHVTKTGSSGAPITTSVTGLVKDEQGKPHAACIIELEGNTTVTDSRGIYSFHNISVPSGRAVITCKWGSDDPLIKSFIPSRSMNYIHFQYAIKSNLGSASSATTHTFTSLSGATVTIPANSLVDENNNPYSGNYSVAASYLNPDTASFLSQIPGGDLLASDNRILYSYGMMDVIIKSWSGARLQLSGTASATITFPIAQSQLMSAPASIPAWHFDEALAMWVEEGTTTRVGNNYEMEVHHFSWWNCDFPFERATITGSIEDCNGNPLPNIVFTVNGMYSATTDANGVYSVWVPAMMALTIEVLASTNNFLFTSSTPIAIAPIPSGQTFHVSTINLSCVATISGSFLGCNGDSLIGYVSYPINGSTSFQSMLGQYSMAVPPSTSIVLTFSSGNSFFDTTITTPSAGNTMLIPPVTICDTVTTWQNIPENTMFVDGGPWSNLLIQLDTTGLFSGGQPNWGETKAELGVQGATQYTRCRVHLASPGQVIPNVSAGNWITYHNDFYQMDIHTNGFSTGYIQLVQLGNVGGRVVMQYDMITTAIDGATNLQHTVHIITKLNVPRTY